MRPPFAWQNTRSRIRPPPRSGRNGFPRPCRTSAASWRRNSLNAAAEKGDWGKPAPLGVHRGIAQFMGYGSYSAAVAEVSVSAAGKLKVHRMVLALDCGHAVNPDQIAAQAHRGGAQYRVAAQPDVLRGDMYRVISPVLHADQGQPGTVGEDHFNVLRVRAATPVVEHHDSLGERFEAHVQMAVRNLTNPRSGDSDHHWILDPGLRRHGHRRRPER